MDPIGFFTPPSRIFDHSRSSVRSFVFSCDPGRRGDGFHFPRARVRGARVAMRPPCSTLKMRPPLFFLLFFLFFYSGGGAVFPSLSTLSSSPPLVVSATPSQGRRWVEAPAVGASAGSTCVGRVVLGTADAKMRRALAASREHQMPRCPTVQTKEKAPWKRNHTHPEDRLSNPRGESSRRDEAPRPPSILFESWTPKPPIETEWKGEEGLECVDAVEDRRIHLHHTSDGSPTVGWGMGWNGG